MSGEQADRLCRQIRNLIAAENSDLSDRELLERFAQQRDEAAFEVLVRRHGPMVLRVCQGVLRDTHLCEDAFQATFLVLIRKVSSIHKQMSVASWLYKVAYRIALRARGRVAQMRQRENQVPSRVAPNALDDVMWRDLRAVFDEELERLPEKYQSPVILCCLEGLARDEAAQQLGWSVSTLKGRLERGREVLRSRLVRRGVALSGALGATLLSESAVRARVPMVLTNATVRSALVYASGGAAATGIVPAEVNALVQGVTRAMTLTKIKIAVACLLVTGVFVAGAGAVTHQVLTTHEPEGRQANDSKPKAKDADAPRPAEQETVLADRYGDPLPPGAIVRLGTVRFRHMHTISSVAYSGDGKSVLSSSWDGTVRLWDASTGKELRRLKGAKDGFSSVAVSPDGTILAGGDMGRTLYLWDAATGKELHRVEKLENTVFGLRFAPDGKTLAGLSGNTVRVWDVTTVKELHRFTGPKEDMRPFAISADLKTFVASLPDSSIHLWDLTTGKESHQFPSGQAHLASLAVSPDGKMVASGGAEDDRTVRLWDVTTGKELHRSGPYTGWVESLTFAPDGKTLAVGEQFGTIHAYVVADGKERFQCSLREGSWVRGLVFSPDSKTLAAGGTDDRVVHFFDAETGKERSLFSGHQNEIVAAVLATDGKSLISAGMDGAVYRWDLSTGKEINRWSINRRGVSAVAVAPDGQSLVIASEPILHLKEMATGKEIRQFRGHKGTVSAVAFSPDGKTLASGTWEDHTIRLWNASTGEERLQIKLPMPNGHNYGAVPLVFANDGKMLISGSGDRANPVFYFWDTATGKELRRIDHPVSRFALSPDGKTLATTGWEKRVRLWDVATGKELAQIAAAAETLAFSPDGRTLAYGGTSGVIHLWETTTEQERQVFTGHQSGGDERGTFAAGVAVLVFTPDGRTLISGGGDTTLLVWDVFGSGQHAQTRRTPKAMADLWADLGADAGKAHDAVGALIAAREEAVSFLKGKLQAATLRDAKRLAQLLADLDSDEFAVRERASHALEALNESAVPHLRKALADNPSAEVRRRLEEILKQQESAPTGDRLRALRAVEVLEHIATPEAQGVLRGLAKGAPEARLTRDAKMSSERLAQGAGTRPHD